MMNMVQCKTIKINTLLKTMALSAIVLISFVSVFSAYANIKVSDTSSTTFHFGGTIAASCKVNSNASLNANSLNLLDNTASQDIGTLEVWCNTGGNATTRYSSANQGYLVSGDSKIPYNLSLGQDSNISLRQEYVNSATAAGFGSDGEGQFQSLKVTTQGTGLDSAGDYSDTITVTVAYN